MERGRESLPDLEASPHVDKPEDTMSRETTVTLKQYNYDTNQMEELEQVSLYLLGKSISSEQLGALISNFINGRSSPSDAKEVGAYMVGEHRSLQNLFVRFCLMAIVGYADAYGNGFTDPRNEGAVKMANMIKEFVAQEGLPLYI